MEHTSGGNISINGSGQISAGMYERVTISGSGKVMGDISAADVIINGSARFKGNVSSKGVTTNGSAAFDGDIDAEKYTVSGSSSIAGHLHGRLVAINGSTSCQKDIRAEAITVRGHLRTDGDIEAESFDARGGFHVKGLINASSIKVHMNGDCYAQEIGGDQISVQVSRLSFISSIIQSLLSLIGYGDRGRPRLQAEQIEATEVSLEWSKVGTVRGNRVNIGPGCIVELVEYTEAAVIDPMARVTQVKKMV